METQTNWTRQTVIRLWDDNGFNGIADAHNAALKAAKYGTPELADRVSDLTLENEQFYKRAEKAEQELAAERDEVRIMTNQCVQLRQELAAEREKLDRSQHNHFECHQQLLAAQTAIDLHNKEQYPAFRAIDIDATALAEHDAALASVKEEK